MIDRSGSMETKPRLKDPNEPFVLKKNHTLFLDILDNQNWEGPISAGSITKTDTLWYDPSRGLIDKQSDLYTEAGGTGDEATFLDGLGYILMTSEHLNEDLSPARIALDEVDRGIYEINS